jgi:hypothetical protein
MTTRHDAETQEMMDRIAALQKVRVTSDTCAACPHPNTSA